MEQQHIKEGAAWKESLNQAWRNSLGEVDEKHHNGQIETTNIMVQPTTMQVFQESPPQSQTVTSYVQHESQESLPKSETVMYACQVSQESLTLSETITSHVQQSQQTQVVSSGYSRMRASSSSSSQGAADSNKGQMRSNSRGAHRSTSECSSQESDRDSLSSTPMSPVSSKPPAVQNIIKESALSSGSSVVGRDPPVSGDEPLLNEMKFELTSWPSGTQSVRKVKVKAHKAVSRSVSHDSSVQSIYTGLMERHIKELKGKGTPMLYFTTYM